MAIGCHTLPQTCRWLSMCGYFWFTVGWRGSQKEQRLVPISVWAGHSGWTGTQDFSVLSKPDGKCLERVTMRIAKTPCPSAESRKWQWANSGLTQWSACWMGRDWPLAYYLLASASPDASVLTFFQGSVLLAFLNDGHCFHPVHVFKTMWLVTFPLVHLPINHPHHNMALVWSPVSCADWRRRSAWEKYKWNLIFQTL